MYFRLATKYNLGEILMKMQEVREGLFYCVESKMV